MLKWPNKPIDDKALRPIAQHDLIMCATPSGQPTAYMTKLNLRSLGRCHRECRIINAIVAENRLSNLRNKLFGRFQEPWLRSDAFTRMPRDHMSPLCFVEFYAMSFLGSDYLYGLKDG